LAGFVFDVSCVFLCAFEFPLETHDPVKHFLSRFGVPLTERRLTNAATKNQKQKRETILPGKKIPPKKYLETYSISFRVFEIPLLRNAQKRTKTKLLKKGTYHGYVDTFFCKLAEVRRFFFLVFLPSFEPPAAPGGEFDWERELNSQPGTGGCSHGKRNLTGGEFDWERELKNQRQWDRLGPADGGGAYI
jgi:hypothetical protein